MENTIKGMNMQWLRSLVFVLLVGSMQLQGHGFSSYTLRNILHHENSLRKNHLT